LKALLTSFVTLASLSKQKGPEVSL